MDPEQQDNLERVSTRIASAIKEFCLSYRYFVAEELREYVRQETGRLAPSSATRVLQDLRVKGELNYVVLSRSASAYEALWVKQNGVIHHLDRHCQCETCQERRQRGAS